MLLSLLILRYFEMSVFLLLTFKSISDRIVFSTLELDKLLLEIVIRWQTVLFLLFVVCGS